MNGILSASDSERAPRAIVIIPAHNEARDIARVIREVREASEFPVVVVDDASTDDTIAKAQSAGARVIPLAAQLGAWGATQAGLRYARSTGCEYAITMDADGQHEASALTRLMQPMQDGAADVVIGACTSRGSRLRKLAWSLMRRVSGLAPEDLTSGFRAYDRRAIEILASWRATLLEYQDVGVLFLLQAQGLRIVDVEVSMSPRKSGISRIFHSWSSVAFYMAYTLLLSFTKRGVNKPARPR